MTQSQYSFDVETASFQSQVVDKSHTVPVMVDFWADWCAPCKTLMPVLQKLVDEYAGAFLLAKVNADQEQDLAGQLGIRSLPTVLLVKDGQVAEHFQGAVPESHVRALLERHVAPPAAGPRDQAQAAFAAGDYDTALALLRDAAAAAPEDVAVLADLAMVLAASGQAGEAAAVLDRLPEGASGDDRVRAVRAKLAFAEKAGESADPAALEQRLAADPGDSEAAYGLAVHCVLTEDYDRALALLLELARRDRGFGEDAARKTLLELFDLLGAEDPRVKSYRRQLFTLLY